jgi:biotin carboxyl carrier protein
VRPDVVLFGEWLPRAALDESVRHVSQCDLLLIVGCAMDVAPASELPRIARESGATVIEVKRGPSRVSRSCATKLLRGDAATALSELYGELAEREDVLPLRGQRRREPPAPTVGSGRFVDVSLPAGNESIVEGVVSRWVRLPGSRVDANDVLCEVELDKATVEVPAPVAGTLRSVLVPEGEVARVDQRIARIELPTDTTSSEVPASVPQSSEPERWPGPRMHRAKDPLAVPLGAFTDATRQLLQQVCSVPLLQPDATLARGDDVALGSVRDRADELAAALGLDEPLRVELFRDPTEAAEEELARWLDALDAPTPLARRWMRFGREDGAAPEAAVKRAAIVAVTRGTDRSARRLGGFATMPINQFSTVVQGAIASVAARGPTPATPCPYRGLLSLWLRGAWPFALPDGLGLWVPLYENATLIAPGRLSQNPVRAARWRANPRSPFVGARWPRSPAEWYRVE